LVSRDRSFFVVQALSGGAGRPLLVARPPGEASCGPEFSKPAILRAVARRGLPNLIEATVVPAVLFYVLVVAASGTVAIIAAMAWALVAVARRLARHQPIPSILVLGTLGIVVRTFVGLLSGSMFAYFLQPLASTVALGALFLGSALVGRPVIGRLAHDFCPIAPEVASRPAVVQLFVGLTVLWAGVHLLTAATTFGMLVSLPVPTFVLVKTITSFGITVAAIVFTVSWSIRIARRENLVFAGAST
jgi:Protein of unknown function (DUF3159)